LCFYKSVRGRRYFCWAKLNHRNLKKSPKFGNNCKRASLFRLPRSSRAQCARNNNLGRLLYKTILYFHTKKNDTDYC
jgi:hypothetical protein